jgi:hypothetical protein
MIKIFNMAESRMCHTGRLVDSFLLKPRLNITVRLIVDA